MLSLRIFVTTLAQLYNITFAPGEMGEAFEKESWDSSTTSYSATVTNPVPATLTDNSQMFKTMPGGRISWEQYKGKQICVETLAWCFIETALLICLGRARESTRLLSEPM